MAIYLYGRRLAADKDPALQERILKAKYPDGSYREGTKISGEKSDKHSLKRIIASMNRKDKLVVWKLDRLAENIFDLGAIVKLLQEKEASLEIIDQNIDTTKSSGKSFLRMLPVFTEFETNIRHEVQLSGLERSGSRGKYSNNQPIITDIQRKEIIRKRCRGATPIELAREYKLSSCTVYNILLNRDS